MVITGIVCALVLVGIIIWIKTNKRTKRKKISDQKANLINSVSGSANQIFKLLKCGSITENEECIEAIIQSNLLGIIDECYIRFSRGELLSITQEPKGICFVREDTRRIFEKVRHFIPRTGEGNKVLYISVSHIFEDLNEEVELGIVIVPEADYNNYCN